MSEKKKKEVPEDSKLDDIVESSRRDFLKKVGIVGAASVTGAAAIYAGYRHEKEKPSGEMVKVLTEDNRLVEIPKEQVKDYKPDLKALQTRGRVGLKGKKWVMVLDLSNAETQGNVVPPSKEAINCRP